MNNYKTKVSHVKAVRFTGSEESIKAIISLVGLGHIECIGHPVKKIKTCFMDSGQGEAEIGDWIVIEGTATHVYSDEKFNRLYELA